jgi:hypothetical protein
MMLSTFFSLSHYRVSFLTVLLIFLAVLQITSSRTPSPASHHNFWGTRFRGGASSPSTKSTQVYSLLAQALQDKFEDGDSAETLINAMSRLASAQQAFKGLDGAAHEAYQRTHAGDDISTSVAGRAQRSAARMGATTEALLACELVEAAQNPSLANNETFVNRKVLFNVTGDNGTVALANTKMTVLVLYEELYSGGAGLEHGTIDHLTTGQPRRPRGRLLVVLGDDLSHDMVNILKVLDQKPQRIKLSSGLVTNEMASVQPSLYKTAGSLLTALEPLLRTYNTSSVHFVGRSLSGGVASLAATILDGTLPLPKSGKGKRSKKKTETNDHEESRGFNNETDVLEPLNGLGRGRSSALTLGAPPCLSGNVVAAYCTSILYGDDVVCRTTPDSIERLCKRIYKHIHSGIVGRNLGFMTDTLSLTVSSLKSHAHGSEGEEIKLTVPGRSFLIRPRRLGGICSIHEVGNLNKGGREALRAGLLWQLHDVLLSTSMWKHHQLESYIHGLDRVQLRGVEDVDSLS